MWVARAHGARDRAARDAARASTSASDPAHAASPHHPPSMLDSLHDKLQGLGALAPGGAPPPRTVCLWPESVRIWAAFLDLGTQWRTDGAEPLGLDYAACRAHLRTVRGAGGRGAWEGIRACEAGYLDGWRHGAGQD